LNLLPFGALVDENGRYLAEGFSLSYLTSGRDVLRLRSKHQPRSGPLVVANPDYDKEAEAPSTQLAAATPLARARRSVDLAGVHFTPLPGTQHEAQALAK